MTTAELLSVEEMYRADAAAMAAGMSGPRLMAAAGWAVARAIRARWRPCRVVVLCGPGNNGGDGFVVARLLAGAGWPVRVALLGRRERLSGDAAAAAAGWDGPVVAADATALAGCGLVVDALFGAGLARPLDGAARTLVEAVAASGRDSVAVDIPSGVDGDSGAVRGAVAPARLTVTFFRKKPGHCLLPGRALCGEVVVADIGIPPAVLGAIAPLAGENGPGRWRLPRPAAEGHKYARGHLVVVAGAMSGAARLAAAAGRRGGAGLVTVAAPPAALATVAADAPGTIVVAAERLDELLADRRRNAWVVGPGLGGGAAAQATVARVLAAGRATVLDADALTVFAAHPGALFAALPPGAVLTPHDGEYARLFGTAAGDRLSRARAAARASGAVVVLKGGDTVIAAADGRAAVNTSAPPSLATAGTGDVLAGLIGGLLAQGMAAFDAACAGVWLQGQAAARHGPGLIAEDLAATLPMVLGDLDAGMACAGPAFGRILPARRGGRRWM